MTIQPSATNVHGVEIKVKQKSQKSTSIQIKCTSKNCYKIIENESEESKQSKPLGTSFSLKFDGNKIYSEQEHVLSKGHSLPGSVYIQVKRKDKANYIMEFDASTKLYPAVGDCMTLRFYESQPLYAGFIKFTQVNCITDFFANLSFDQLLYMDYDPFLSDYNLDYPLVLSQCIPRPISHKISEDTSLLSNSKVNQFSTLMNFIFLFSLIFHRIKLILKVSKNTISLHSRSKSKSCPNITTNSNFTPNSNITLFIKLAMA